MRNKTHADKIESTNREVGEFDPSSSPDFESRWVEPISCLVRFRVQFARVFLCLARTVPKRTKLRINKDERYVVDGLVLEGSFLTIFHNSVEEGLLT